MTRPGWPRAGRADLYDVEIRHQRAEPVRHGFDYTATAWVYDAGAPPRLARGLRWLAAFDPRDHEDLAAVLGAHGIDAAALQIRTMANPRQLGYCFNPLSLHWCHRADGALVAVVAEVHNTYGERHCYVVHPDANGRAEADKAFYVSPFYPVDGRYRMSVAEPGEELAVTLALHRADERPFVASMRGRRRTNDVSLWTALRSPLAARQVMTRIKRHGITLWLKGLRPFPRPAQPTLPETPMTTKATAAPIDAARWPDIAATPHQRLRALAAKALTRRVVGDLPIRLLLPGGEVLGRGTTSDPAMTLVRPDAFYQRVGATGLIGFGEAFMAGDWIAGDGRPSAARPSPSAIDTVTEPAAHLAVDDLAEVLTVFADQLATLIPSWMQRLRQAALLRAPSWQDNTVKGSQQNISHHYDLSNDLFQLFLDPSLTYSSALFDSDPSRSTEPLMDAQVRKIIRLLDAAGVREGTRLLEIGTGWGELAIQAALRGAHVTTITLSQQQAELADKRIHEAGLSDRIEVRRQDYREVTGAYDAIVSVEMIEAVGANHWPEYFAALHDRLAPGGRIGLQAITMPHDRMVASMHTYTWVLKYIFPGGQIASVRAIREQARAAGLQLRENFGFGAHYAETLRRWRANFEAAAGDVEDLGFDLVFRRMWSLYLAYSEAGFKSGYLDVNQFVLTREAL